MIYLWWLLAVVAVVGIVAVLVAINNPRVEVAQDDDI